MKLTLAFLAALAAADAAEARSHRQRRQYGSGYGTGGGYGDVSSAKPIETPSPATSSVAVPYVQSSAEAFETSTPPDAASSYPPVEPTPAPAPPAGGEGYPVGGGKSSTVPAGAESSSVPVVAESSPSPAAPSSTPAPAPPAGGEGYPVGGGKTSTVPAGAESASVPVVPQSSAPPAGGDYGAGYPVPSSTKTPAGVVPSSSLAGVYPSGGAGVPSGAYPSGGASLPVEAASSIPGVFPTGGAAYPTGTGATPLTDLVTKTIYSTQIKYESSALVTKTVPISTTVCAADEADATPSPAVPTTIVSEIPVTEVVKTLTETLVYTVGVGSTAHPVTTEVVSTSTSTQYTTIIVTVGNTKPSGEYPVATPAGGKPEGPTGTSTLTSTSTSTKYVTVKPTPTGSVPVGQEGYPVGGSDKPAGDKPAGGLGEDCAVPVTVTVTAKETVTVTAGQNKPSTTPAGEQPGYPTQPEVPAGGAGKPSAAPTPLYPIGNGTNPYPAGPTGFKTSTKPSLPVGTGVPTKPSETSSLPYFSFASDAAVPSSKVPADLTKATPSPTPVGNGGYGSGYGEVPAVSSPAAAETPVVPSSKVPADLTKATPSPTPAGNGYGSGYGTY